MPVNFSACFARPRPRPHAATHRRIGRLTDGRFVGFPLASRRPWRPSVLNHGVGASFPSAASPRREPVSVVLTLYRLKRPTHQGLDPWAGRRLC